MSYKVEISKELMDLIPLYKEETQKNLQNLMQAIENKDYEQIRSMSHKIKGSGGSYGFKRITELAKQIEDLAKTNSSIESIKKVYFELKDYFDNLEIIFVDKPL